MAKRKYNITITQEDVGKPFEYKDGNLYRLVSLETEPEGCFEGKDGTVTARGRDLLNYTRLFPRQQRVRKAQHITAVVDSAVQRPPLVMEQPAAVITDTLPKKPRKRQSRKDNPVHRQSLDLSTFKLVTGVSGKLHRIEVSGQFAEGRTLIETANTLLRVNNIASPVTWVESQPDSEGKWEMLAILSAGEKREMTAVETELRRKVKGNQQPVLLGSDEAAHLQFEAENQAMKEK